MDDLERQHAEARDAAERQAFAALVFARSWASFRNSDAIVLGKSGASYRVIEEPCAPQPVRRVSGGMLRP